MDVLPEEDSGMDERLRLIFTACHPALAREAQLALTLRTVAGLTTTEVARALLVSEATAAQRIVRAKRKIREAGIPFREPDPGERAARLGQVLDVLYLLFNEGYLATSEEGSRPDVMREAEWLASLVVRLLPDEPEAAGLLALMRLNLAREDARFEDGSLVLLEDQDRSRWDRAAIADAVSLLERAGAMGRPGPFQVQAAIAACHATASCFEETDWDEIVALYDLLHDLAPTPVVRLNRAIADSFRSGPDAALLALDELSPVLDAYALYHSARGELLRRAGRASGAEAANRRALDLATNPSERRLLSERLSSSAREDA
jgi:RNA polymerase sigma-70 factor (ECF subfamily)